VGFGRADLLSHIVMLRTDLSWDFRHATAGQERNGQAVLQCGDSADKFLTDSA
jgi:hypothetical protein